MTREEASNQINDIKTELAEHLLKKDIEALDMAISALSVEGDLISRTEVINAIDEREDVNGNVNAEDIRTDICLIPSKSDKGEWIHVSERLPKKNTRCLVAVGLFNLTQMATYSDLMGTIDHTIFYQGDYGRENFADITEYVKAWMPLPEPYKKGGEDA